MMGGDAARCCLARRTIIRGAGTGAMSALLAACGREPGATARATAPTATPAPTRVLATPPPPSSAASAGSATPSVGPVELVWKADHGLLHPGHLALDDGGNLYVTDDENQRVVKFDTGGQFLLAWGSRGTGDGEFRFRSVQQDHSPIAGIAVDARGVVFVCDATGRVQTFDPTGVFLGAWSAEDHRGSLPVVPAALALAPSGHCYVVDTVNHRVLTFTPGGQPLLAWGAVGAGDGRFSVPSAAACDRQGNIYVVDINNNRVQKFDASGHFLGKWGTSGFAHGQFNGATGIAVDTSGDVYVADTRNHRIQKFTNGGQFTATWGTQGAGDGEMRYPTDVAVDEHGAVYVVDDDNNRILKFHQR